MKLKLAISTCPNDTFMFDALINGKVDTGKYEFDLQMADVEQLNQLAFEGLSDISKISYHTFFKISDKYQLLNSGSALGNNCGPLIVSKRKINSEELKDCKIAIPGVNTTANLLMKIFFSEVKDKKVCLFSDIEDAVLSGDCDAGLVIHETRFTYKQRGLMLFADLGEMWEQKFSLPIPLGGIAVKRDLPETDKKAIDSILRESIKFAFANRDSSLEFIKNHAVELDEEIIRQHIDLYVNDFSIDLGLKGKESVDTLANEYKNQKGETIVLKKLFV